MIPLTRDCEAVQIPSGSKVTLPKGRLVMIAQSLGGTYTVTTEDGWMVRIDGKDADALGQQVAAGAATGGMAPSVARDGDLEKQVWEELKTIYDPEIPVNIVDLGLVYQCALKPVPEGYRVEVTMTLTAPGCGMGDILRMDAESKISRLTSVKEVQVEVVVDPPWSPSMMSEAAKLQLGMF